MLNLHIGLNNVSFTCIWLLLVDSFMQRNAWLFALAPSCCTPDATVPIAPQPSDTFAGCGGVLCVWSTLCSTACRPAIVYALFQPLLI